VATLQPPTPRRTSAFLPNLRCKIAKASRPHPSRPSPTRTPNKTQWALLLPNQQSRLLAQLHADSTQNNPLSRRGYHRVLPSHRKRNNVLILRRHQRRVRPQALSRRDPNITPKSNLPALGQTVCPRRFARKNDQKPQRKFH
jgi:hypothetical protein